jgi:G3E family GTPase
MAASPPPLPLTVIGGYLGAGKTTLVNHLLRHADGLRLAVLVNEFGELPIDGDLIEGESGNVISIAGGCVCCSYGNDLILALRDLVAGDVVVDHVLLEASGVGIPGAIGATVSLLQDYRLDGVVVVADAETVRVSAADRYMGDTVRDQLGQADIVILNKADLVGETALVEVASWLSTVAPEARQVTATRGRVAPAVVLESFLGRLRPVSGGPLHATAGWASETFAMEDAVVPDAFARSLVEAGYVRAKGFVRDRGGGLWTVQVVGRRSEVGPAPADAKPGLVAIRVRIA